MGDRKYSLEQSDIESLIAKWVDGEASRAHLLDHFPETHHGLSHMLSFKSEKPGPELLVVGATHADEPNGVIGNILYMQHLQRIQEKENRNPLKKGLYRALVGHPEAVPDNVRCHQEPNLNRAFAHVEGINTEEVRRAQQIEQYFDKNRPAFVLDLHSNYKGNPDEERMAALNSGNEESVAFVQAISKLPTIFEFDDRVFGGATLIECANRYGIAAAVIECGLHDLKKDPASIPIAVDHIGQSLLHADMIDEKDLLDPGQLSLGTTQARYIVQDIVRPRHNWKEFKYSSVERRMIKKGEVYATEGEYKHVCPDELYSMMFRNPKETDNKDVGFLCKVVPITDDYSSSRKSA